MSGWTRRVGALALLVVCVTAPELQADQTITYPFLGVTHITRTEISPRNIKVHVVKIDLTAPWISFRLTSPGGTRETVRQTTLEYIVQERAQIGVNAHFFLPFPSTDLNAALIGIAASSGNVYSGFELPAQNYALVKDAPGLNIDTSNNASIVHRLADNPDGLRVAENVTLSNVLSGSAQIITNGVKTLPCYVDASHPDCALVGPGPANYSNSNSWYSLITSGNRYTVKFNFSANAGAVSGSKTLFNQYR